MSDCGYGEDEPMRCLQFVAERLTNGNAVN